MVRSVEHHGKTLWFVADDQGQPVSYGYPTEQQADQVAELLESSNGQADIPAGVDIDRVAAAAR